MPKSQSMPNPSLPKLQILQMGSRSPCCAGGRLHGPTLHQPIHRVTLRGRHSPQTSRLARPVQAKLEKVPIVLRAMTPGRMNTAVYLSTLPIRRAVMVTMAGFETAVAWLVKMPHHVGRGCLTCQKNVDLAAALEL